MIDGLRRHPVRGLLVVLLACALVMGLWVRYVTNRTTVVTVNEGETRVVAGMAYSLESITANQSLTDYGGGQHTPLPGATYVTVVFETTPVADDAKSCSLMELQGDRRFWRPDLGVPVTSPELSSTCKNTGGRVQQTFQVPTTALGEISGILLYTSITNVLLKGHLT